LKIIEQQEENINPFVDSEGWNTFLANHLNQAKEIQKKISM